METPQGAAQAEAKAYKKQQHKSESLATTTSASQSVADQAVKGKKRARSFSSIAEAGDGDDNSLSKQRAAQLLTSAHAGKQRSSHSATAPQAHGASKNALRGLKADQKLDMAVAADTKQQAAAKPELQHILHAGAQPKAKKLKTASHINSKPTAPSGTQGNNQAHSGPATQQAASTPPAGEHRADASAAKGKQKKLGRNARLRLKRQAYRQQALLTSSTESQGQPAAEAAVAQPAAHQSKKTKAAREQSLSATRHGKVASEPGIAVQAVSGDDKQIATLPAKPGGSAVKQRQQPAATAPAPAEKSDVLPTGKLKKKGLLEQMRSKLSGGRFRMLNEQLYTTEGQHAFQMMQAQPDLYQQYHEVCIQPASLFPAFGALHPSLYIAVAKLSRLNCIQCVALTAAAAAFWFWTVRSVCDWADLLLRWLRKEGCVSMSSSAAKFDKAQTQLLQLGQLLHGPVQHTS